MRFGLESAVCVGLEDCEELCKVGFVNWQQAEADNQPRNAMNEICWWTTSAQFVFSFVSV